MIKTKIRKIGLILILASLASCSSVPRFTSRDERYKAESTKTETKPATDYPDPPPAEDFEKYKDAEVLESVTGVASYYADKYNGRVTYGGEVYDMNGISAAHPTYQMGTVIRVTNLSNNKSAIMRINDRMPYRPDRIIDLSLGAARELDMVRDGITEVRVDVLEWGTGRK
jgi:rare lipoprotein A